MVQKVSNFKTAAAYAEAWLGAAKDMNAEEAVFEEAKALKSGIGGVETLWDAMASPIESTDNKLKIIAELKKKAHLSDITTQTLKLAAENNRLKLMSLIAEEFIRLYYQDKGITEVFAESAVELEGGQKAKLQKIMEKKLKAPVVINYTVKPEVLGGLAVRFGSYLVDDTIKSKLMKLEQLLAKGN